jgi:hypothetical protein
MRPKLFVCIAAVACLSGAVAQALIAHPCSAGEPTRSDREIDRLIGQLGNPSFELREAASRRLTEREDAVPALRRALKSPDAEVARRAREILKALAGKEEARSLAKTAELAKHGAVDQAIERLVRREKWGDESGCWQVMADLEAKLKDLERQTYGHASAPAPPSLTDTDPFAIAMEQHLEVVVSRPIAQKTLNGHLFRWAEEVWKGRAVLRAEGITKGHAIGGLCALSGDIKVSRLGGTVFAGGSIEALIIGSALIVCDGDVTILGGDLDQSLVIARGTVRCGSRTRNSRIISCGEVVCKHPESIRDSKVVQNEPKPLGFVTFFDPADAGIKVEKAESGVRVKEAAKGKRFAVAGLRADDLVTAIDADAVKDYEGFRRRLRAKLAVDAEMTLKVRRADQTLELRVPARD